MLKKIITVITAIFMLNACSHNNHKSAHNHNHMDEKVIHFKMKTATLSKEAMSELDMLAKHVEKHKMKHVKVFGHVAKKEKQSLSKERADAVVAYLKDKGVKVEMEAIIVKKKDPKHKSHGNAVVVIAE